MAEMMSRISKYQGLEKKGGVLLNKVLSVWEEKSCIAVCDFIHVIQTDPLLPSTPSRRCLDKDCKMHLDTDLCISTVNPKYSPRP